MGFVETVLGLNEESFFNKYWEKYHYHSSDEMPPERLDTFFSSGELESFLHDGLLTSQYVRLASAKGNPPVSSYTSPDGRILNDQLFYLFNLGNTVVVRNAEFHFHKIREIGNRFQSGAPIFKKFFVNLYLTPKNSQGFVTHYDTQEVFIVQVLGAKKWTLYIPSSGLPLENIAIPIENSGEIQDQVMLREGNALYIPRGVYHQAQTSDELSCHLTFSYVPVTNSDVLELALQRKIVDTLDLRRSYFASKELDHHLNLTESEVKWATDEIHNKITLEPPGFAGHLKNKVIVDEASIIKRSRYGYSIDKDEKWAYVKINAMQYKFPIESFELIEFFEENTDAVRISDVPSPYDPDSTLAIVERLLGIDYLEFVKT
jgi:hypothetical protein